MADVSKVKIQGVEYTVKDAAARADAEAAMTSASTAVTNAADKVSKTGDTMTGTLNFSADNMNSTATTLSETTYYVSHCVIDANGKYVAYMQEIQYLDGMLMYEIAARHEVSGSNVDLGLRLRVAADGTQSVWTQDKTPWNTALSVPTYQYSTSSISAGSSLTTGKLYITYQ